MSRQPDNSKIYCVETGNFEDAYCVCRHILDYGAHVRNVTPPVGDGLPGSVVCDVMKPQAHALSSDDPDGVRIVCAHCCRERGLIL